MWGRESGLNSDTIDFHVVENFLIFLEYMFLCLLFTLRTVSKGFNCCVLKQLSPVSLGRVHGALPAVTPLSITSFVLTAVH